MQPTTDDAKSVTTDESTELDKRDVRALTECHSVLPEAEDMYRVVGENGGTYTVDARLGACECPDWQYREPEGGCKHMRRVAYATGETSIPAWVDPDAVDPLLGDHLDGLPRVTATDGSGVLNTDDTDNDGRPDDCGCGGWNDGLDLPCWPCYQDGFETPATDE